MSSRGLELSTEYKLTEPNSPTIHAPSSVPLVLRQKLKEELDNLIALGMIEKVEKLTEWFHFLVIVEKKDGTLRLCLDPKQLKYIKREHFPVPTREESFGEMADAKYFPTQDASVVFWQFPLEKSSTPLCTFNTAFGRYSFLQTTSGEMFSI